MEMVAALLPVTSQRDGRYDPQVWIRLKSFATNAVPVKDSIKVFLGIDENDLILNEDDYQQLREIFSTFKISVELVNFEKYPTNSPPICKFWRELARIAFDQNLDYFVLLGDDVLIESSVEKSWPDQIHEAFQASNGFGCFALTDKSAPGFATFPVVSRRHLEIFGEKFIIPEDFINQDGDPYLWELYRRWDASKFLPGIQITNQIGGMQLLEEPNFVQPRYHRQHIDWKDQILNSGTQQIRLWLRDNNILEFPEKVVIDIVVPSYRVVQEFLMRIISLSIPNDAVCMFHIIVDQPKADIRWLRELERKDNSRLRVRMNMENLGASGSRNVGLEESAADWVLFLDDDVIPEEDLLSVYIEAIKQYGDQFNGFVGMTHSFTY
eukprot:gene7073-9653_t